MLYFACALTKRHSSIIIYSNLNVNMGEITSVSFSTIDIFMNKTKQHTCSSQLYLFKRITEFSVITYSIFEMSKTSFK